MMYILAGVSLFFKKFPFKKCLFYSNSAWNMKQGSGESVQKTVDKGTSGADKWW
jgi:hypothetical protein